jgi:2-polyprenyl-3-methyl-5-hydroxy-6-metoxy-1,4-benzoquinol methylase
LASKQRLWETIYRTKAQDELSWHQDEPALSLRLIQGVADRHSRVIDIGGGTSNLARCLLRTGSKSVTVLDIADAAIRSGPSHSSTLVPGTRRLRADVTNVGRLGRFDIWHDRAVFHFLTDPAERRAYVDLARRSVPVGGHVILATFALDGPETCSGLSVERYDAGMIAAEFSKGFTLVRKVREIHTTPWGTLQPFQYVVLRRVPARRASVQDSPTAAGRAGHVPRRKVRSAGIASRRPQGKPVSAARR